MKKFTPLVLFAFIFFQSCSKHGVNKQAIADDKIGDRKNMELSQMSVGDQPLAFNLMNSSEKYNFWHTKLANAMNNASFNNEQRNLIAEVSSKLKESFYEAGQNDDKEIFNTVHVPDWIVRAKRIFTNDQIYYLFFSMSNLDADVQNAINQTPQNELTANPECRCNLGSQFTCQRIKLTWNNGPIPSVSTEYGDCSLQFACDKLQFGCGFGSLWSCNGSTCTYSGTTPPSF